MEYFEKYRAKEFVPNLNHAKSISFEMRVETDFPIKHRTQQRRQLDESYHEEVIQTPYEDF